MELNDHGLLANPLIAKQFALAVADKNAQIESAVAKPPFDDEQKALFLRTTSRVDKSVLDDDIKAFSRFYKDENLEFLRQKANLASDDENKTSELHSYMLSKWQNKLDEKINAWKNSTAQGLENDFFVRMQAWFDALLKARELEQMSPELFGEDGLMMDAVGLVGDALDTSNLGDEKTQKAMLEALSSVSDIDTKDEEVPASGYKGQNHSKKLSLAQILKYFNKIKNNKALIKICDMLGKLRQTQDEIFTEKIKEKTSFSYTQNEPTKRFKEEICGVELGNDLATLIPQEFSLLNDDDLEILFDLKLLEKRLFCFEKQGLISKEIESVKEIEKEVQSEQKSKDKNKGAVILCVDTSGSMSGEPEITAKALTLFIASRARREARACYLINFSSDIKCEDLSSGGWGARLNGFLAHSFGGGTDVGKALEKGVEMMSKDEFRQSDLLVISDGDFDEVESRILSKMDEQRELENRFFLLDITEKSKALNYFDKHFLYDGKNVKVLGELASEIR